MTGALDDGLVETKTDDRAQTVRVLFVMMPLLVLLLHGRIRMLASRFVIGSFGGGSSGGSSLSSQGATSTCSARSAYQIRAA